MPKPSPTVGVTTATTPTPFKLGLIEKTWTGVGPSLVMLGDSITALSREELHRVLDARYRNQIGAIVGEGFGGGPMSRTWGVSPSVMGRAARRYAVAEPDIAVIALGTNDAWNPSLEPEAVLAAMGTFASLFQKGAIVAVEVSEWSRADGYDRELARAINAELHRVADAVVPALPPEHVQPDMIHPTQSGRRVFAEEVLRALISCAPPV